MGANELMGANGGNPGGIRWESGTGGDLSHFCAEQIPHHPLLAGALEYGGELLDSLAVVDFTYEDIAAGVGSDGVGEDHLAGQATVAAEVS